MKIEPSFRIDFRWLGFAVLMLVLISPMALAQEMPAPRKMPRTPVNRQALSDNDKAALRTRDVKGPATIIDGEHLRVADVDLRLFGIVPPQLSASFGPQARSALDEVSRGQDVECHIRDRDHDGHFLATCATVNTKADLALELLKRGLAVAARGSVQPTELAVPYETAEQAAQTQKIGLWSVVPPPPATVPVTPPAAKADNPNLPPLPSELKKEEKPLAPAPTVKALVAAAPPIAPANTNGRTEKTLSSLPPPVVITGAAEEETTGVSGFFARYQLLFTGVVMLITALGIMFVLAVERRRDRRDEMKAIAAALRGELLAARAVCQSRLKSWTEADERSTAWPRIRATLYQAYVGRLGWLGAVLARQVASIYGQAADYAAYFSPSGGAIESREAISKRQALLTLVQHIEEVLPKLAHVEQTGNRPKGSITAKPASAISSHPATPQAAVAQEEVAAYAAAPVAAAPVVTAPIWDMVKKLTQLRHAVRQPAAEEPAPDYTTLIEEEMARMSAEEEAALPPNITKMRGTGG